MLDQWYLQAADRKEDDGDQDDQRHAAGAARFAWSSLDVDDLGWLRTLDEPVPGTGDEDGGDQSDGAA